MTEELVLTSRRTLDVMVKRKAIYCMGDVSKITGLTVRYLRLLARRQKMDCHRLFGRYYMTPDEVAALLVPMKKRTEKLLAASDPD